jgi:hypothetical protein
MWSNKEWKYGDPKSDQMSSAHTLKRQSAWVGSMSPAPTLIQIFIHHLII